MFQALPYFDQLDYVSTITDELCYSLAVEKLLNIEVLERASRMSQTEIYSQGARKFYERVSGARLHTTNVHPGDVACDIPYGLLDDIYIWEMQLFSCVDEIEEVVTAQGGTGLQLHGFHVVRQVFPACILFLSTTSSVSSPFVTVIFQRRLLSATTGETYSTPKGEMASTSSSEPYYSPDPAMIFSGIVACATDMSTVFLVLHGTNFAHKLLPSDLEVLSGGIIGLGGQWRTAGDVTHLFALHKQSDKYQTAMHFASQTHMSILTPHWFERSVQLGHCVPEGPYLWPDPQILQPGWLVTTGMDEHLREASVYTALLSFLHA
ncbi:hypothetical protein DFH29DRAFT_1005162 [Suillus ampliporus]|nr:hypothetical protein DFH29DRAFT_1005162 [Suillus ampliporus]